jgi:magnesium-transporting ATPase (P-type)
LAVVGGAAAADACSVGLLRAHETDHASLERSGLCLSGEAWAALTPDARAEAASKVAIMYRVEPQHKIALVQHLRDAGEVVVG